MSYSFCFGPSGSGKSHYLRKMIIERAGKSLSSLGKDRTKYIVIVPEQYSMQTQHELIDEDPRHVLMNVDVLSFGRLAHRVFSETGEDRRAVLDDIGKSLLLRRAASSCFSDLQILRRGIHSPGMIDEIKSVLSEFMQYGIGLEQIEEMAVFAEANKRNALSARLFPRGKRRPLCHFRGDNGSAGGSDSQSREPSGVCDRIRRLYRIYYCTVQGGH